MSNVLEYTDKAELEQLIKDNDTVVVDFAAPSWCVPCQRFAPHFEKAAEQSDASFVHVDVDKAQWAMVDYGVQSVPTVILIKNGEYVKHLQSRTVVPLLKEIEE